MPIYHFGKQLRPDNSIKCGLYVILFIHYVFHFGLKNSLVFYIVDSILKKDIYLIMINMLQDTISNIYQNHLVHIGKLEIREQ